MRRPVRKLLDKKPVARCLWTGGDSHRRLRLPFARSVEEVVDMRLDFDVRQHNVTTPLQVLWGRSVGYSHTAFVVESVKRR
jgi:hypothetical protein